MYSGYFRLVLLCTGAASACTVPSENEQGIPKMNAKETEEAVEQSYLDMYRAILNKDSTGLEKVL